MPSVDHAVAAILAGDDDLLSALLAADATLAGQRTMFGVSPLHAAVAVGREDLLAQLRPEGPLPLVLAAELGDLDAVASSAPQSPRHPVCPSPATMRMLSCTWCGCSSTTAPTPTAPGWTG